MDKKRIGQRTLMEMQLQVATHQLEKQGTAELNQVEEDLYNNKKITLLKNKNKQ